MFKHVTRISDILPHVEEKSEIRFMVQSNGITIGCYMFAGPHTFDSPEALECRGIAFDHDGKIVSRPLHKFFNVGEKEYTSSDRIRERDDIIAVYEKLDGSMIATAWVNDALALRSKKSFQSDVVKLANRFLDLPENTHIRDFCEHVAVLGMTAIFELTHPDARIVVAQDKPRMRLLHVRDNRTGEYVMLNPTHNIHRFIHLHDVPLVPKLTMSLNEINDSLEEMVDQEGYVLQFANGDMVKIKCPWYVRLHRSITFLRERDIAVLALNEEIDDVRAALAEAGIDLSGIDEVQERLAGHLSELLDLIEIVYKRDKDLSRKDFAISNKGNVLFSLLMQRYLGLEIDLSSWYTKNRLKVDFSLKVLASDAVAEAIEG